jgi:phosphoserine phosphatase RsbU/P
MALTPPAAPGGRLWPILREDARHVRTQFRGDWRGSLKRTLAELREFYLSPDRRKRLAAMHPAARIPFLAGWLVGALLLKLAPIRRVILAVALVLLVSGQPRINFGTRVSVSGDTAFLGSALLVVLLLLELKDKLLARHELEAGRAVQRALMPEHAPVIPGWDIWMFTRPANDVGGDLVDYLEVAPGRLEIVLADVAGKALPAALLMAKVQATLRALAGADLALSDLAGQANRILCRDGLPDRFVTLVYLDVAADSGHIELVNAGHMPPVVATTSGFHGLPRGDLAMGLFATAHYVEQSVDVGPGEMLVVYSDGVTEAMNASGEFFGEERLAAQFAGAVGLTAAQAGERILAAADEFIGDARPYDDLSLIVLKRAAAWS